MDEFEIEAKENAGKNLAHLGDGQVLAYAIARPDRERLHRFAAVSAEHRGPVRQEAFRMVGERIMEIHR